MIEDYGVYSNNAIYRFKLMSDQDLINKSVLVYDCKHLTNSDYTLDSNIFGSSRDGPCSICGNSGWECPGHYAVIELPFPIPVIMAVDDWRKIIPCVCPMCSHIPIPNVSKTLMLPKKDRLTYIKTKINNMVKASKDNTITCSYCGNRVILYKCETTDLEINVVPSNVDITGTYCRINPIILKNMLNNFTQIEEVGFSETFHPKNFMSNYIPIITTKLRPKTNMSSESVLTGYYKTIIEEILPELYNLYTLIGNGNTIIDNVGNKLTNFLKMYNKLYAYYIMLSTPPAEELNNKTLEIMKQRDKSHYDPHNPLLGRFKGKDKSVFGQGIVSTRVNKSARTVLGGAVDASFENVCIPYHIKQTLTSTYKVYEENVKFIRVLIGGMSMVDATKNSKVPVITSIIKRNYNGSTHVIQINKDNAKHALMKISPGDAVVMSLIDSDFAIASRFPIVREESCTAFEIKGDNNTIITFPLAACKMKMADFDGDECELYCLTSHATDAESLMLYSAYAQYLAYKDGNPAIWYSADAPTGMNFIRKGETTRILNGKGLDKELDVIKIVESYLPEDLCYIDSKTEIINGKFQNDKYSMGNMNLYKYIYQLYGADLVEELMNKITQLAYDLNENNGVTLGFDIKIFNYDKVKKEIEEIKKETYRIMCELELSNDPEKDQKIVLQTELQKPKITNIIIDSGKGSFIDKIGFLEKYNVEYYQSVAAIDHIIVDGKRPQPTLAEGTRVTCNAPRFSIDPKDYGYHDGGYNADIPPTIHFLECKQQRLAIYEKGAASIKKQGYLTKKLSVGFSKIFTDFNGAVVDNFRILSPQYGACGLNPRYFVKQPMFDVLMPQAEFQKKYKVDPRLCQLQVEFQKIHEIYKLMTSFIKQKVINPEFGAGFDYDIFINTKKISDKPMPMDKINAFIERLFNNYCTESNRHLIENNFKQHEYYFRAKLQQLTVSDETLDKLFELFSWTFCDGGEPVGEKAALACSEPLSQAALHVIHNAGGGGGATVENVVRTSGATRFEELMSKPKTRGTPSVMAIKLYDDSFENCNRFVCNNETIVFTDIWKECYINISNKLPEFIKHIHPNIDFSHVEVNDYYCVITIDLSIVANYEISISDIIYELTSKIDTIEFITGYATNQKIFAMYIFFRKIFNYEKISATISRLTQHERSLVIHGRYIKNCYITENVNTPGHYLIECNDVIGTNAYGAILRNPEVDPCGTRYNDMRECLKMLGVCETSARHYEELVYTALNLSATKGILQRHYKVVADTIYSNGEAIYADRNNFKYDRFTDTLRFVQFETPKDMLKQSIKNGDINPVADPFAARVFNEAPSLGTGVSKITLFQTN